MAPWVKVLTCTPEEFNPQDPHKQKEITNSSKLFCDLYMLW